jgi:hypothetical protein
VPSDENATMTSSPSRAAGSGRRARRPDAALLRRVAYCAVALSVGLSAYASAHRFDPPAALAAPASSRVADPINDTITDTIAGDSSVPTAATVFRAGHATPEAPAAPTF